MTVFNMEKTRNNIFSLCEKHGISDSELARKIGVTPQCVSKWRRGVGTPSLDNLVIMSGIFGVSIDEILGIERLDDNDPLTGEKGGI